MRTRVALIVVTLCGLALFAHGAEPPPNLIAKEQRALKRLAGELYGLAKYCASNRDYTGARRELEKALVIQPAGKAQRKLLDGLAGKEDGAKPAALERIAKRRAKVYLTCARVLAKAARDFERRGFPEYFDKHVNLVQVHFRSDALLKQFDLVYFEPYLKWVRKTHAKKLEAGGEFFDGKWLDADAVRTLDREHDRWNNPWVLTDGVHELRTTMRLRTARTLMAHASAYRKFLLLQFAGTWDLQLPKGKLPVIVTRSQNEMAAQAKKFAPGSDMTAITGAAYYMMTNGSLNPCFVTFEPKFAGGQLVTVELDAVLHTLRHELTHQIAFEYSKHDYDATRMVQHHFWSVEAIANFMQHYEPVGGAWVLRRPTKLKVGDGFTESDFAWCVKNRHNLPRIADFVKLTHQQFMTVENYHVSATLAYFLLHAKNGAYRLPFVKLLERVHKVRDTAQLFVECFQGTDLQAMEREFREFVAGIVLE